MQYQYSWMVFGTHRFTSTHGCRFYGPLNILRRSYHMILSQGPGIRLCENCWT